MLPLETCSCTSIAPDCGRFCEAAILFREMSQRDVVTWNTMMSSYFSNGKPRDAACASIDCLRLALQLHGSAQRHGFSDATSVNGYVQFGYKEEAFGLFNQMMKFSLVPDAFAIATVLGACAAHEDSILGLQLHGYTVKTGIDSSIPVGNSLITMYGKVGNIQNAEFAFNLMPMRNIISWTAMISAFSHGSNVEKAHEYFDKMPERNVVSWNSMMAAYLQNGFCEEGLQLYILMVGHDMMPDSITFATLISACADFALLEMGKQIMAQAEKSGFALCVSVANSAINMYSKCGQIIEAEKVFNSITSKDVVSWNSLMAAYAQNGQGIKVVETFETMLMLNYAPDCASFVSLLMGCSHAGLVEKGCHYFNAMKHDHGVCPAYEHYACMVDLLSRAGFIECALKVIAEMPFEAAADVWGSLLAACHTHRYTTLVEFAARQLLALEVLGPGGYSLLANMYSDCGKLEHVAGIRKMMRDTGIHKIAGCSWIEVHNRVHVFTAHCSNHPQIADVLKMLEELWNMKDVESNENVEDFLYSGRVELLLV